MTHFILIIWLAIGATQVEQFQTQDQCFTRLGSLLDAYQKAYVVRSSGCFPREFVI